MPMIVPPSWTATVTWPRSFSSAGLRARMTPMSVSRSSSCQSRARLDLEAVQVAGRGRQLGRRDLDVVQAHDGVDLEGAEVEALADDLPMDLALGRDVDDRVARRVRGAAEAAVVGEAARRPVLVLERAARRQMAGQRRDAVLGERAQALDDLAAAAQPAPAADGIEIDAEGPRCVEHGGTGREAAAPPRRREDDERLLASRPWADQPGETAAGVGPAPPRPRLTRRPRSPSAARRTVGPDPAAGVLVVAHEHVGGHDRATTSAAAGS